MTSRHSPASTRARRPAIRVALSAAALAAALATGFALARLSPVATSPSSEAAHGDEDDHHEDAAGITPAKAMAAGITVEGLARDGLGLSPLSGRVEAAIDARAPVSAIVAGRVERLLVAPGQTVRAGQAIAILVSPEAATLRAEADAAQAQARTARAVHQRDLSLHQQGWAARQKVDISEAEALGAEARARAASARVVAAGAPDASGRILLRAPIGGVVVNLPASPGRVVADGDLVAEISDPSRVDLVFRTPPQTGEALAAGMTLRVSAPGREPFSARIIGVSPDADPASGAAVVRARAIGVAPPPGTPVSALAEGPGSTRVLTAPADAVQTVEGRSVVFVAEPDRFRMVPVRTGRRVRDRIEILEGLNGDERIAAKGAFLLKAELAKGEAGHGH